MRKLNILVIDDDEISNFLFVEMLESLSVTESYRILHNGREGLDYIIDKFSNIKPDNLPPDIIFLDYRMPIMDAKEFIEALKKENLQYHHLFNIFVVSAQVNNKDREHFLNNGVKGILEKPLTEEKILNVITRLNPVNYLSIK